MAQAAQATLVADAHVNSALPTVNSGAISNLDAGGGYTALLQFDLSMLPAGTTSAQVARAVLRLYVNRVTTASLVTYAPVGSAWGEYSVTYATEPTIGAPAGVFSVSGAGAFVAIDVTAMVQGWITAPSTNNGIALSAGTAMVQFDSKENDQTSHGASLDVELVDAGPQGATGAAGTAGLQGAIGAIGLSGPAGLQGKTGATGLSGAAGPTGSQGLTGPAGTGISGAIGPQGLTGPAGPQGTAGVSGAGGLAYQGTYSSVVNYALGDIVVWQGSSYTSLIASNHGNTPSLSPLQWGVLAAQGPAGTTGASGTTGAQGPQGLLGSVGPNGPLGAQGPQGIAGQAGAQGIPGTTGVTGLSGPMGPQGVPGPVGITFQGTYASTTNYALADGVSYNGAGYVSLVASNHGNTPSLSPIEWALFAAAGTAGATGPAGLTGGTGPAGPIGPQGLTGTTGSTGAIGPQGPPVANYLGSYQSSVNYALHDAVSWQGSTYVSLIAGNQGNTPSLSLTQWAVLAAQGASGAIGAAGPAGATGTTGVAGTAGAAGPQGPPATFMGEWLIGTPYALGQAASYAGSSYIALAANVGREPDMSPLYWGLLAAAGSAGPAGAAGAIGAEGPAGYAGLTGAVGAQGPAGPTGGTGTPGAPGTTGSVGPAGATGTAGPTGANGIPGTNGTNGTNGAPGPPGMTFLGAWIRSTGYAATDSVAYGGSTYIAQIANNASEPDLYPAIWTLLAQAGSAGPSGPTGSAASLTIGTVTTGVPGSQAAVSNTGTSTAAVLNFTIPQGAAGTGGSGSEGGGTSGIPFASVYHSVQNNLTYPYYSVNTSTGSTTEAAPYSVLTWTPTGCTATSLTVFSEQGGTITVTVRVGTPGNMVSSSQLTCTAVTGNFCRITGSDVVPANGFVDMVISGANNTGAGVWTALACN
jgi:hypothetical protein